MLGTNTITAFVLYFGTHCVFELLFKTSVLMHAIMCTSMSLRTSYKAKCNFMNPVNYNCSEIF